MRGLKDDSGVALVIVLVLAAVALAITTGLVYMIARGSYISGVGKQYKTALEAGVGGADVTFRAIATGGSVPGAIVPNPLNMATKLTTRTSVWAAGIDNTMTIDPNTPATYDLSYDLGNYRVYSKIVDTVPGNTGIDEGLAKSGVVSSTTGELVVMSNPYLYTIEVLAQRQSGANERAKLSILYEY